MLLALDAMGRHGLSAYDAAYLALAESEDGELLTFDRRLAAAAGSRAMTPAPGHAIEEAPETYGPLWATWPGAASYLRQLRVQLARQSTG